jgi:hypothetical protein
LICENFQKIERSGYDFGHWREAWHETGTADKAPGESRLGAVGAAPCASAPLLRPWPAGFQDFDITQIAGIVYGTCNAPSEWYAAIGVQY